MSADSKVNVLLVDDQPGKLLTYEVMLKPLGENLIKASSAKEALEQLLKTDIAVILVDVCMPELDGFELATMIREHPRFQKTAIIFISAIHISEMDYMKGYSAGAVDYVPVPVVADVLRAKVRVFAELYRKTRELEQLNRQLEQRISERTAALESSTERLLQSERGRSLALAAGNMGSWDYDVAESRWSWDKGHCQIFGLEPDFLETRQGAPDGNLVRSFFSEDDWSALTQGMQNLTLENGTFQREVCIVRADGHLRSGVISAAGSFDADGNLVRVDGVTLDITERKEAANRQSLLAREVDHRARNALAVVQAIVRLGRADNTQDYIAGVEGRIRALAQTHELLSQSRWQGADMLRLVNEEISPYRTRCVTRIAVAGPSVILPPDKAQTMALALHELATNAAKYGALSNAMGEVGIRWELSDGKVILRWTESKGPAVAEPRHRGFGMKIITASIAQQSGGEVRFDWRPEGLDCTISLAYAGEAARAAPHPVPEHLKLVRQAPRGPKVLLAEDEALVGMLIRDMLEETGCLVTGPMTDLESALHAAKDETFDAAVLDINLGGSFAYPLADLLHGKETPFVFLTGYAEETVDELFSDVPILRKPIEREALETALRTVLAGVERDVSLRSRQ
ncbi:MAG: response regulator [Alphaproteobacteria bacterium]|nr:response regulator [Alphaproteobacteria bacterium]